MAVSKKKPESDKVNGAKMLFLLEAIKDVQETNRFLDTKAGVLVGIESTLLFAVVATIFDSQKYTAIKETLLSIPLWQSVSILIYCLIYMFILIFHIIYTLRVLEPSKSPEMFVNVDGFKPKRLFFLSIDTTLKQITPSLKQYASQLRAIKEDDITNELIFELMKMSYIRDNKSSRVQFSIGFLKYLIAGVLLFGIILVAVY
ncbi:MAG: hypothetical protein KJZ77_07480 [Anaerolineales bacterium]|nr:hypothetical protein [Anaerolineales bacterium]